MNLNIHLAYQAASKGDWSAVKTLAGRGVDLKAADAKGRSLVWRAAYDYADFEEAKWLIDQNVPCLDEKEGAPWLIYLYRGFRQRHEDDYADYIDRALSFKSDEILMRKFLAHRFSIKGSFNLIDRMFSYGGFLTDFTFPEIGRSISKFFLSADADLTEKEQKDIVKAFTICDVEADPEILFSRYRKGKIVNIPTGWDNHSTAIIIKKGVFLIKGNKGSGKGKKSIQVFEIGRPENITIELFQGLLASYSSPQSSRIKKLRKSHQSKRFFRKEINQKLGLAYLSSMSLSTRRQKSDNCCWSSSAKPSFRADLFIIYHQRGLSAGKAWKKADRTFKKWCIWDRKTYLSAYISSPNENKDVDLIKKIRQKCSNKEAALIAKGNLSLGAEYRDISSCCSFQSSR